MTCEAVEPSQICVIDRTRYLAFLEKNGELALKVIQLLSHEGSLSFDKTDQFAFSLARERMAALLLELADRYGETTTQGSRISLHLKREELAQMAAMTVETAVRLLHSLQADQIIKLDGRAITILRPEQLGRAAGQSPHLKLLS